MIIIPYARGFSPLWWKLFLEVMLEKDAGNPMIHRLRIIVLLEADFNITLRIILIKRLFPMAKKMGFVEDQWGNRKTKHAPECQSMKLLLFESNLCLWTSTAIMAMESAAYYAIIITDLFNICERRHGLLKTACKAKNQFLLEMLWKLRTAYG